MNDIPYRAKISLYASLSFNLLYAVFKLITGIHYASFWYGADALFYIGLSAARFLMLRQMRRKNTCPAVEYRQYRHCGCFLFALCAALIGVVYQVVNQNMGYQYPGLMIYAVATYAFSCLTLAIIGMAKSRKFSSPTLSAVNALRLAKALVAIFALQTAMLFSFGIDDSEIFKSTMKILTGGGVCLFIFGMAFLMVVRANKALATQK